MDSLPEHHIDPPELFQEESMSGKRKSITIVEIRHDQEQKIETQWKESDEMKPLAEDKENIPEEEEEEEKTLVEEPLIVAVRRRSCSSNEGSRDNSRRTSPLYSEPADAIPPSQQQAAWMKKQQQNQRPLPQPPPLSVSIVPTTTTSSSATVPTTPTMDFQTFTKDGYVRCTMPALTTKSNPRVTVQPSLSAGLNNKSKQVSMPKPPRQLPHTVASSAALPSLPPAAAKPPLPPSSSSVFYLPTATEDNSLTIQVNRVIILSSLNLNEIVVCRAGGSDGSVPHGGSHKLAV